ncbi:hypothetical protein GY45DRAFT_1371835 [Cubamyces sp. BRFM 1775]|nr:hypothetical protein GY45DRAFT_1371835 [Cubamyces sp. BRFM 1775]
MDRVFTAIKDRYSNLTTLFRDQKLELDTELEKYACGLFYYRHFEDRFWNVDQLKSGRFMLNAFYDEGDTDVSGFEQDKNATSGFAMYDATDGEEPDDEGPGPAAPIPVKAIIGLWNGFIYTDTSYPARAMLSLRFCQSSADNEDFMASGVDYSGDAYRASGVCGTDTEGCTTVEWSIRYSGDLVIYYRGRLSDTWTIEGRRGQSKSSYQDEEFILKRIPAELMCLRPSPAMLRTGDKPRILWRYAIVCALQDVRRRNWSWMYFAQRRDIRKRFIKLKSRPFGRPVPNLEEELGRVEHECTAQDARFYYALTQRLDRIIPNHSTRQCSAPSCRGAIGGGCVICLDCVLDPDRFYVHLNFCDDPRCYNEPIHYGYTANIHHDSSHTLLKIRTVLHAPDIPAQWNRVDNALRFVRWASGNILPDPPMVAAAHGELVAEDDAGSSGSNSDDMGDSEHVDVDEQDRLYAECLDHRTPSPSPSAGYAPCADVPPIAQVKDHSPEASESGDCSPGSATGEDSAVVHTESRNSRPHSPRASNDLDAVSEGRGCRCKVCKEPVYMGMCWFCLSCWDYICNDCDTNLLIGCHTCGRPFPQLEWYWGTRPSDFICPRCSANGIREPPDPDLVPRRSHVGTHQLIQCKHELARPTKDDAQKPNLSVEERLANLEERMTGVDTKLEQLQEHLLRLEQVQEVLPRTIAAALGETLMNALGRAMVPNGHAD